MKKNTMTTEAPEDDAHTLRIVKRHRRHLDSTFPLPKMYEVDLINAPKDVDWDWWDRASTYCRPDNFFKEGSLSGKFTTWFEDGECESEDNFINGVRNGKCTKWFEDGECHREDNFINGVSNGYYFYKNPVTKQLTYGHHKNGEEEGKWIEGNWEKWYKNGKIIKSTRTIYSSQLAANIVVCDANYKDGVLHGRESSWYENGQPSSLIFHEEGVKISGSSWYENGQKQSQVKCNRVTGEEKWTRWYEDGQIKY